MIEKCFSISRRIVGPDHPPYIIAELSGNHNGDVNRAFSIMKAARDAGADAVKLQTYTADTITIDHDGPGFLIEGGVWAGRQLYDLYQEAHTPWDWHEALFAMGRELGITVFSSPFDKTAVDFLEDLDCPAYKIASFEAVDIPLVEKVASTGKPLMISTGMVTHDEILEVLRAARDGGAQDISLLHCVSAYPAMAKDSNLNAIPRIADEFKVIPGLSDHTLGTSVAVAAVALGARIIEKHVTLSRADGGVDSDFSLEPHELKTLVEDSKTVWQALGEAKIGRQAAAVENTVFKRSLYVVADINEGELFTDANVRSIRPGFGLPPKYLKDVIGRACAMKIPRGTPLKWELIQP